MHAQLRRLEDDTRHTLNSTSSSLLLLPPSYLFFPLSTSPFVCFLSRAWCQPVWTRAREAVPSRLWREQPPHLPRVLRSVLGLKNPPTPPPPCPMFEGDTGALGFWLS